jgi:hypothetical protein
VALCACITTWNLTRPDWTLKQPKQVDAGFGVHAGNDMKLTNSQKRATATAARTQLHDCVEPVHLVQDSQHHDQVLVDPVHVEGCGLEPQVHLHAAVSMHDI